jgi:phosphohistidine phosphatase
MRRAAAGLARAGVRFDRILSSPLVRAVQTARIVAELAGDTAEVVETDSLAPGVDARALARSLIDPQTASSVLLVGHEPDVSALVEAFTGGRTGAPLRFNPGTVARIDVAGPAGLGAGSLVWILSVEAAERLTG